jgi:hypothetical protein
MENGNVIIENSKEALGFVTNLSLDAIILIALFIVFLGYGFKFGRHRLIAFILSLYIAMPIFAAFPYSDRITFLSGFYAKATVFLVILIILNFIINRFMEEEFPSRGLHPLIAAGFLSASAIALLLVISYHILPVKDIYSFASPIDGLFSSAQLFFWWLIAPLAVLLFTARR